MLWYLAYLAALIAGVAGVAVRMGMHASTLAGPAGLAFVAYGLAAWLIGRASRHNGKGITR